MFIDIIHPLLTKPWIFFGFVVVQALKLSSWDLQIDEGVPHQPFDKSRVAWWRRCHLMLNAISCIMTKHMLILYKEELGNSTRTNYEPYLAPKTTTLDKVVFWGRRSNSANLRLLNVNILNRPLKYSKFEKCWLQNEKNSCNFLIMKSENGKSECHANLLIV